MTIEQLQKENEDLRRQLSHVIQCDIKARQVIAQLRLEIEGLERQLRRQIERRQDAQETATSSANESR